MALKVSLQSVWVAFTIIRCVINKIRKTGGGKHSRRQDGHPQFLLLLMRDAMGHILSFAVMHFLISLVVVKF